MFAVTDAQWAFFGVLCTNFVALVALFWQGRRTRKASEGAYEAVNGVDKANGEEKLIDQVRDNARRLDRLEAMNEWKVGVLQQVAEQVGVRVPPLPEAIEHREHAA